jgi:uncharacterized protein YhaN
MSGTNCGSDIRIIKTLSGNVSQLLLEEERVRQALYQAHCEVQKLEGWHKAIKKELAEARDSLASYAPDWNNRLKIEHWKDY